MPTYNKGPCDCCGGYDCIECPLCKDCTSGEVVSVTIQGVTGSESMYNGTYTLVRSLVNPCQWVYFELGDPTITLTISESSGSTTVTIDVDDCVVWSIGIGGNPGNCRPRLLEDPFIDCGYDNWSNATAAWGWGDYCCVCEDCGFCPGEDDVIYIVLEGTNNDGIFDAVWNVLGYWDVDFGLCSTQLKCNMGPDGSEWMLFENGDCPIGGPCFVEGISEGSPVVLSPAIDCDNCELGLPNGTISIYWTCNSPPSQGLKQKQTAILEDCNDGIINRPSAYMVSINGNPISLGKCQGKSCEEYKDTTFEIPANDACVWAQQFENYCDTTSFYIEVQSVENGVKIVCTLSIGSTSDNVFTSDILPKNFDASQTITLSGGTINEYCDLRDVTLTLVPEYF